jgi:hypothetical protein
MLRLALTTLMIATAGPALAGTCQSTQLVFSQIAPHIATTTTLSLPQSVAAKRIYARQPPEGSEPDADKVVLFDLKSGNLVIFFIKGDMICHTFAIPAAAAERVKTAILGIDV